MRFIDRLVRRLSGGASAERAELAGNLSRAIELWAASGAVDEAARVMLLRGDAEADPKMRLQHYTQAAATAKPGSSVHKSARTKRARLVVSLVGDGASPALRRDLIGAGGDLEDAGEFAEAADVYARAGDTEAEARALAKGGEVDRLEGVLERAQRETRVGRRALELHAEIDSLTLAGQRRAALRLAEASPDDPLARSRASRIRGGRALGPRVRLTLRDERMTLVLGSEVTIGRSEGAITVASSALSRRHVVISRPCGNVVLTDLGSRNGTQLRGQDLAHALTVEGEINVTMGGLVPLHLSPSTALVGAIVIDVAGDCYVASLGDAKLHVGDWQLVMSEEGWVELVTHGTPAFLDRMALAERVTLLRGDAIASQRDGAPELRIDD